MAIKYKKLKIWLVAFMMVGLMSLSLGSMRLSTVHADPTPVCDSNSGAGLVRPTNGNPPYCSCPSGKVLVTGAVNTCADQCPDGTVAGTGSNGGYCNQPTDGATTGKCADLKQCDLFYAYINPLIRFLSALVGVAVVASVVVGGIQYSSSAGDPQKASAAKNRIRNALLALVTYIFLLALLNFLIPGGLV